MDNISHISHESFMARWNIIFRLSYVGVASSRTLLTPTKHLIPALLYAGVRIFPILRFIFPISVMVDYCTESLLVIARRSTRNWRKEEWFQTFRKCATKCNNGLYKYSSEGDLLHAYDSID
jgi:hypothetical protein